MASWDRALFIGNSGSGSYNDPRCRTGYEVYPRGIFVWIGASGSGLALAKDSCTHEWRKGSYKTHRQLEDELRPWLADGKIIRFSLCTSGNEHYFQVTILESAVRSGSSGSRPLSGDTLAGQRIPAIASLVSAEFYRTATFANSA